jgi:hypothetical protein
VYELHISDELQQKVRRLFGPDEGEIIIRSLVSNQEYMISCSLSEGKVFDILSSSEYIDILKRTFVDELTGLQSCTFNVSNNSNTLYITRMFNVFMRCINSSVEDSSLLENQLLTFEDIEPQELPEFPTLKQYIARISLYDRKTLIDAAIELFQDIPDCMMTGNPISKQQNIVVTLALSKDKNYQPKWLLRVYDGRGRKDDEFNALKIKRYFEKYRKDPETQLPLVAKPAVFPNFDRLMNALSPTSRSCHTLCFSS